MIGSVIAEIAGSRWEGRRHPKNKSFFLFTKKCRFTDDTVLTCAVADVLMNGGEYSDVIRKYYKKHPNRGYGGFFKRWAKSDSNKGYGSWGNGSAMRVSPIAFYHNTEDEVLLEAERSAEATHNHEEGIRGAKVIALATFIARKGGTKEDIVKAVESLGCRTDVLLTSRELGFDCSCKETVPQAVNAFLYSRDYVDCVRKAVMMGGDSDTIAAMAGSIAHAYYKKIPNRVVAKAFTYLTPDLKENISQFMDLYVDF